MLLTAKAHFDQDISRARALQAHAVGLPKSPIADDILRAGWMMAVGACDAYFSDAYADLISRSLRAKELQPAIKVPDRLNNLKVPVAAILRTAGGGWRWRMAARELIETENVLSIVKIKSLFNHFFRKSHKLFTANAVESWILHRESKVRLFGVSVRQYRSAAGVNRTALREQAVTRIEGRFEEIVQRRHDCIHNCDRPKVAIQAIKSAHVDKAISDIVFIVERCHEDLRVEFPVYLKGLGFSGATRNQVCAA